LIKWALSIEDRFGKENDAALLVIGAYRMLEKEFGHILIYDIPDIIELEAWMLNVEEFLDSRVDDRLLSVAVRMAVVI
jgi:hypothetical protein